jgi:hypothetical protein
LRLFPSNSHARSLAALLPALDAFPFSCLGRPLALVGNPFAIVGSLLALVGDALPPIGDAVTLIGAPLALIGHPLATGDLSGAVLELSFPWLERRRIATAPRGTHPR